MNLLLLTPEDHLEGHRYVVRDFRAQHMKDILHVEVGSKLRAGVLNGATGTAHVDSISGEQIEVTITLDSVLPVRPNIDLLLALPRPRSLKKLLPQVTAMGVGNIILTETQRVEKSFFGATFLKPEAHRDMLYEGLMQSKLTFLPTVTVERKLWKVLEQVPERFENHIKLVGHPDASTALAKLTLPAKQPVLLAIGPEGGFLDREVDRLVQAGFQSVTMGDKTLRVETACVALLAQVDLLRQQS